MNPRLQKTLLTAVAAGLQAAALTLLTLPAPWGSLAQGAAGLLVGWAHFRQPGSVS